jgi:hypothetical protein
MHAEKMTGIDYVNWDMLGAVRSDAIVRTTRQVLTLPFLPHLRIIHCTAGDKWDCKGKIADIC